MAAATSVPSLVKFLAVGRLVRGKDGQFSENQHQIIASKAADKNDPQHKSYKQHVQEIMNRGAPKLKAGRRIRLTSDGNDYDLHVMGDLLENKEELMIVFFAVTTTDFGATVGRLLEDLKTSFYGANSVDAIRTAMEKGSVHKASASLLMQLISKYGTNRIAEVQAAVDKVKDTMQENLAKSLDNVDRLEELEAKAENVADAAKQFEKKAGAVESIMRCKNYKTTAIVVGIIILILLIIIVPVAIKLKNS